MKQLAKLHILLICGIFIFVFIAARERIIRINSAYVHLRILEKFVQTETNEPKKDGCYSTVYYINGVIIVNSRKDFFDKCFSLWIESRNPDLEKSRKRAEIFIQNRSTPINQIISQGIKQ